MRRIAFASALLLAATLAAKLPVADGTTLTVSAQTLRLTQTQQQLHGLHRASRNRRHVRRHGHPGRSAALTASGGDPVLFGDPTIESGTRGATAGLADAFPFSNQTNGATASIAVYLDSSNQASKLIAGLYTNNNGEPGSLIASGSLSSPTADAWNTLTTNAVVVSAGRTYWIAVLGEGGKLFFRDRMSGPCNSMESRKSNLRYLPFWWGNGTQSAGCPISAYVNGYLLSPVNTASPVITGQTVQGHSMSASTGTWSNSPMSYAYQWQDCTSSGCANIGGATSSSYTVESSDVGDAIDVVVTATNSMGSGTAASAETPAVVAATPPPTPAANTAAPAISGQSVQGQTLTTSNGSWTNTPTSYVYQWQDCDTTGANCTNISGATSSTYTLAATDVGRTIRSSVTATNAGGSTLASSAATSVVVAAAPVNSAVPVISGQAAQGQTLTTSNGSWTNTPTSYVYQWQDCTSSVCANISGATSSSYTVQSSDVGDAIDVVVTATNPMGFGSATSAKTSAVVAVPSPAPVSNTAAPTITGTATVGQQLTTSPGTWSNCGTGCTYTYQWDDCSGVSGGYGTGCSVASGSPTNQTTYTIVNGDYTGCTGGCYIQVLVTATASGGGQATHASPATSQVTSGSNSSGSSSSYGGSSIQQVQLAANTGTGFSTFQSHNNRTVYVPNGGGIFVAYLASWVNDNSCAIAAPTPATGPTDGCQNAMYVDRSTNNGASFTHVLHINVGHHAVPSLEADAAGNVYAFIESIGATDGGGWIYKFPASNWTNPVLIGTLLYGWDDKFTSGYDPAGPSAASGGTLWQLHGGDGPTPGYGNALFVGRVAANDSGGGQLDGSKCTTGAQQNCYIAVTTNDNGGSEPSGGVFSHYPHIYFDRSGSCPSGEIGPCDLTVMAWTNTAGSCAEYGYYDIRYLISADGGETWYGTSGAISYGSFPIEADADGPSFQLLNASEYNGLCSTASNWLDSMYIQDGHIYFLYRQTGSDAIYRRVTPTWTGSGYTVTTDEGPTTLNGLGDGNCGAFFSGYGTANSRIFLTGPNSNCTGVVTLSSTNDGQTWSSYANGPSTSAYSYGISGSPTLGPTGDVLAAFTNQTNPDTAYFVNNP
jgi:hypothetical protein